VVRLVRGEKQASCWVSEGTTAPAEAGGPGVSLGLFFNARHDLVFHTGRGCGAGERPMRVVGWSLVENCTVDASILFSVVKLSRANGGCLGTRSR
jgi:hypothetical protein